MNFETLTEQFAIPGALSFEQSESGLLRARVTTPACTAELYLQGAHLTHWQPAGQAPALFLSPRADFEPGKPIRGGVPVVFPWFADRKPNEHSSRTDGPSHGFARIEEWAVAFAALSGEDLHLTLTLSPSEQSRALGFDGFRLAYQLVIGRTLTMRLTVANTSSQDLRFEEALHTYLAVGDATKVRLNGLNDTEYLDKTDHFLRKRQTEATLTFAGETDRPYLNTQTPVLLEDPVQQRIIIVTKNGSHTTVIWNPWAELSSKLHDLGEGAWRRMTCIEAANAAENAITLAPQGTHTMEARISVEPADF